MATASIFNSTSTLSGFPCSYGLKRKTYDSLDEFKQLPPSLRQTVSASTHIHSLFFQFPQQQEQKISSQQTSSTSSSSLPSMLHSHDQIVDEFAGYDQLPKVKGTEKGLSNESLGFDMARFYQLSHSKTYN